MTAMTAPGERSRGGTRRWLVVLVAALAAVLLGGAADDGAGTPGTAPTVGECVGSGQVWLHVETDEREVLRSECVGEPDDGLAALRAAEVATSSTRGGYLCQLAGYPETCPTRFDGSYWQYWHAPSLDAGWTFSQKGPGARSPGPGSIEGWCYTHDEKRCELPRLDADHAAADRIDKQPASANGLGPWATGGLFAALGAAVVVAVVRRRRTR